MSRVPHPEELSQGEQAELDRFAAELRAAYPATPLSQGFRQRLAERMPTRWTMRAALRRDPLLRVAAGLLVTTMAAAPVAALVTLWQGWTQERPEIGFEVPEAAPEVELVSPDEGAVPVVPPPGWEEDYFTPEWRTSLERSNRMALAADSWSALGAAAPQAEGPAPSDWAQADAGALWQEFLRRCAAGDARAPQPALEARVRALQADPRVAAWLWVLDGEAPQAAEGWPGAPFRR